MFYSMYKHLLTTESLGASFMCIILPKCSFHVWFVTIPLFLWHHSDNELVYSKCYKVILITEAATEKNTSVHFMTHIFMTGNTGRLSSINKSMWINIRAV